MSLFDLATEKYLSNFFSAVLVHLKSDAIEASLIYLTFLLVLSVSGSLSYNTRKTNYNKKDYKAKT